MAIRSVLDQTYKDFEIIVVDDGSTDDTEEVIKKGICSSKVKYIKREKNSGGFQGVAKNEGIRASVGKYIAYLDSDNTYRKNHLQTLVEFLESAPFIDGAYGDRLIVDEETGKYLDSIKMDFDPGILLNRNYIDVSDIMHKREIVYEVGGWNEKIKRMVDWDLFARMVKAGAIFTRIPVIITDYVIHKGSISNTTPINHLEFSPFGSKINAGNLDKVEPMKVAIFTLTKDRLEYTKKTFESMDETAGYPYDHFVVDNGSTDGTIEYLQKYSPKLLIRNPKNYGISKASNQALDSIGTHYDIIVKVDNDCEFLTENWLKDMVDIFRRNRKFILSPYVEGLRDNPGGTPRLEYGYVKPEEQEHYLGITYHIGGICCGAHKSAYIDFDEETNSFKPWRWNEKGFLHGNQDVEFSNHCRDMAIQPAYMESHRVEHIDGTQGQEDKLKDYFKLRKKEKTTRYEEGKNV
jgi:glycosyltransferase involved in cell wall biosynthesis